MGPIFGPSGHFWEVFFEKGKLSLPEITAVRQLHLRSKLSWRVSYGQPPFSGRRFADGRETGITAYAFGLP